MREKCVPVFAGNEVLDIVGTGGDGIGSVNISTGKAQLSPVVLVLLAWIFDSHESIDCAARNASHMDYTEHSISGKEVEILDTVSYCGHESPELSRLEGVNTLNGI